MSCIVGLFTDVLPAGGVQRAGRHVAAVAAKFAADRGFACAFLSLSDPRGVHSARVGDLEFAVTGHGGNKLRFVGSALQAAAHEPVMILALHPHLAPVASLMKLRAPQSRAVVFAHGVEVWKPLGWPRGAALRAADRLVGPSEDTVQRLLVEQRVSRDKVQKLPWGLDPEFEAGVQAGPSLATPAELPTHARVVLTVGRWDRAEQYKGTDTLIAAMPQILRSTPDAALVLVGDGNDRPRLEQLARDLQVHDCVHFRRNLSPEQLAACYSNCDVFALPSRGEGFGMVFLEAMAYGKPVIGGAHAGVPDIVEDGKTGLLVTHGDVRQLAQAIEFIFEDRNRAREMGARGRERLVSAFAFKNFQARLTKILTDVLAQGTARV